MPQIYLRFKCVDPPATRGGEWVERVIRTFRDPALGTGPSPYLSLDMAGAVYGATCDTFGDAGVVFKLTPSAPGAEWNETVLHKFTGGRGEGHCVSGGPILGRSGEIYGASTFGYAGLGSIFELEPPRVSGDAWRKTVLHIFSGIDGSNSSSLTLGADGRLYGIASAGGLWNHGAIFELQPPAAPGGEWTETVLYSFTGVADGADPVSSPFPVLLGRSLFGVAHSGGPANGGTIFRLSF